MFSNNNNRSKKTKLLDKTILDDNVELPDPSLRPFSPTSPSTWESLAQINNDERQISLETIDLN